MKPIDYTLQCAMRHSRKQDHERAVLQQRLRRQIGRAIGDYDMIGAGHKVMVCVSGGKDSLAMLDILLNLQRRAPIPFELIAVTLDQGHPGFPGDVLIRHYERLGVTYHMERQDTYSIVKRVIPGGQTLCGLCSRLRRGVLYTLADKLTADRIALGHHADDIVETLFLNLFYAGRMKAMPPRLLSDTGRHVVIRPLAYCRENDLARYAELCAFPVIPCDLCGSQTGLRRQEIKGLLRDWERQQPGRTANIFRALGQVVPSHLLDRRLHDFSDSMRPEFASSGQPGTRRRSPADPLPVSRHMDPHDGREEVFS